MGEDLASEYATELPSYNSNINVFENGMVEINWEIYFSESYLHKCHNTLSGFIENALLKYKITIGRYTNVESKFAYVYFDKNNCPNYIIIVFIISFPEISELNFLPSRTKNIEWTRMCSEYDFRWW